MDFFWLNKFVVKEDLYYVFINGKLVFFGNRNEYENKCNKNESVLLL